jgi:protein-disulfide isomerase
VLKVNATLTSFVNGEMLKGSMSLDELDGKIKSLLKK